MKKFFYFSAVLALSFLTSCGSDDNGNTTQTDDDCFVCEGDFGATVCDNEDGTFTATYDDDSERTVSYLLVGAEDFGEVENFISERGCNEDFLSVFDNIDNMMESGVIEECVTCSSYTIGDITIPEQEFCKLTNGNLATDSTFAFDTGELFDVFIADFRENTTCE